MKLKDHMVYQQCLRLVQRISQRYDIAYLDWLWLVVMPLTAVIILFFTQQYMQLLDYPLFVVVSITVAWSGWRWLALRYCYLSVLGLTLLSMLLYVGGFNSASGNLILNLGLGSFAAARWLVGFSFLSLLFSFVSSSIPAVVQYALADKSAWAAVGMGMLAFFVRWYESYLVGVEAALMPLGNLYDVLLALVLLMLLVHLYLKTQYRDDAWHQATLLGGVVMGGIFLLLNNHYSLNGIELRPHELGHVFLKIHVPAMVMAYALLFIAGAMSASVLVRHYGQVAVPGGVDADGMHDGHVTVQRVLYRLFTLGFFLLSLGLLSGMLWSDLAWGDGWLWEVKQTTTFAVWCYYAAGLHALLRRHDSRVITAWWLVFGILLLVFALFWSNMLTAGHHFFGQLPG